MSYNTANSHIPLMLIHRSSVGHHYLLVIAKLMVIDSTSRGGFRQGGCDGGMWSKSLLLAQKTLCVVDRGVSTTSEFK